MSKGDNRRPTDAKKFEQNYITKRRKPKGKVVKIGSGVTRMVYG